MATNVKRVFDLLSFSLETPQEEFISGKIKGKWINYSTAKFCEAVDYLSKSLIQLGVQKGSRVAVMSSNRPEWNISDFAIIQIGAYQVPLYPTLAEHDIEFILKDADVSVVFIADEVVYKKIKPCVEKVNPNIKLFSFDSVEGLETLSSLVEKGKSITDIDLEHYKSKVEPSDILTLIYTSGTTGTPKGVMLTHDNLVQNFTNSVVVIPPGVHKTISFLPLSHIFERMICYMYLLNRSTIYYAESMETIVADIQFVKPNAFSTVPRLLEKVYDKIMEKGKELSGIKKGIFYWSVALAENYSFEAGAWYNFKLNIARKLVFKKWQEALGGNIVAIVSGGAALSPRLSRIFWAAGMSVFEGYGLTETSPVISVNSLKGTRFGTVGETIQGVEVKIAADGEVLTRGHSLMKGYYNRPDLTAEAIDAEGWFHTGDIGEMVEGRFLKITDRKKEMFKTAGGKYIAPQMLENKFKESVFIEQIMVIGENRKFPSALVVPNFASLKKWCEHKGIPYDSNAQAIQNEKVIEKFQEVIDTFNVEFGKWEQVKRFALLDKEWSIDGGELTPKLSFKRKVITEKNIQTIEKIYKDAENFKAQN